jgi:hypothetical protein
MVVRLTFLFRVEGNSFPGQNLFGFCHFVHDFHSGNSLQCCPSPIHTFPGTSQMTLLSQSDVSTQES